MRRLVSRLFTGAVVVGVALALSCLIVTGGSAASASGPDFNGGDVGSSSSMVLDNGGNPVVAFVDDTNDDLKLLYCGNPQCGAANTLTTADSDGFVGGGPSLVLDSRGFPVVSYIDYGRFDLKVLRCGNATCSSGNTIRAIEIDGIAGGDTSLALDANDRPVIAFVDYSSTRLNIVRCATAACDGAISVADSASEPGVDQPSLALKSDGRPVVSFHLTTNYSLNILHCGNVSCTSGNQVIQPDSEALLALSPSLAIDSRGFPVIAYRDSWNADLMILRCETEICDGANTVARPDTAGSTGGEPSMRLDDQDRPIVSYVKWSDDDLKLLRCGDPRCGSGNSIAVLDSQGSVGTGSSIFAASATGLAVSYYDQTNGDLKIYRVSAAATSGDVLVIAEPAPVAQPMAVATPRPPATATATPRPPATATATPRPPATATSIPLPTATVVVVRPPATATPTPRPTATATPRPTATATPQPTATPRPTATPTPRPTATPTPRPTAAPTPTPTAEVLSITVPSGSLTQAELDSARARWDANRPNGYTMTYTWTQCCFSAPSTVAEQASPAALATHWHGESAVGSREAMRTPKTVDQLFDTLQSQVATTEQALRVTFDTSLGFPISISGDGYTVTVASFVPEYVVCSGKPVSIFGGMTASTITGTALDDVILGSRGNDTIDAGAGNDTVCAGGGNDVIAGGPGEDHLFGEGGEDIIRGAAARDVVQGGPGNDMLYGDSGNDLILGGDGSDTIYGGVGGDTLYGQAGNDLVLAGPGFDKAYGGIGDDNVQGAGGDDYLDGGDGNDAIFGKPGNDEIRAGNGNDEVYAASGDDLVYGGAGDDRIQGASGDDELFGGDGNDTLWGQNGDDLLAGGANDDSLYGGAGSDELFGQDGTDTLHGGGGTDTCVAGSPGEPDPALCSP